MLSDHINKILTGIHAAAFRAFATKVTKPGVTPKTPDVVDKLIETLPEYKALDGIKDDETGGGKDA